MDILKSQDFRHVELVDKGWSNDKKYYIETINDEQWLLRISDISVYEKKKKEYEALKSIKKLGVNMSMPIDFGVCNEGKNVYMILSWIEGEEASLVLPKLSKDKQYELGIQAGKFLRKIHSIEAPQTITPWSDRYQRKMDVKIEQYHKCGIKVKDADKLLQYMIQNRALMSHRNQTLQHGDYHVGNLIVTPNHNLGVIDFNRFDYGDPWEEYNRIVWSVHVSESFSNGQLHGYFDGNPPLAFFKLMATYIVTNAISSIPWAIPFGEEEVNTMIRNIEEILDYYDGFSRDIPTWYKEVK